MTDGKPPIFSNVIDFLNHWIGDGQLQSFSSRESFRQSARYLMQILQPVETTDAHEVRLLLRAHKQLKRYSEIDPVAIEIEQYVAALPKSPEEPAGKPIHDEQCANCGSPWSRHLTNKLICPDAAIPDAHKFRQAIPENGSPVISEDKP